MIRSPERLVLALTFASCMATSASLGDEPPSRRVPDWGDVVDPSRDCKVSHDPIPDRLTITVPGSPHVLSAEVEGMPLAAPRVVRGAPGDFKATVRVAGHLGPGTSKSTHYDPYHGAGLLVWKDERNYLRLERALATIHGRPTPYLNYELRKDGRLVFSQGLPIKDQPVHLKIERSDGDVRAWQSANGSTWSPLPALPTPMTGRVEVGVVAINSSRHPLRAELERFRLDLNPGGEPAPRRAEAAEEHRVSK